MLTRKAAPRASHDGYGVESEWRTDFLIFSPVFFGFLIQALDFLPQALDFRPRASIFSGLSCSWAMHQKGAQPHPFWAI